MLCGFCGNETQRLPTPGGHTCAGCKASFVNAPDPVVRITVTGPVDGLGRQPFTTDWHDLDNGRVRGQMFRAVLVEHVKLWTDQGRPVDVEKYKPKVFVRVSR